MADVAQELVALTQELLKAIGASDWSAYTRLCDPSLTAFEPEAMGQLVEGMPFHRFYFDLPKTGAAKNDTLARPHVRILGDVGVVTYVRVAQRIGASGQPTSTACEETRIWHRQPGGWKLVHFHRSAPMTS